MSYDIERKEIYRSELTKADIDTIPGLEDILFPGVTTIIWESTGDFELVTKTRGETFDFHVTREMAEVIAGHVNKKFPETV